MRGQYWFLSNRFRILNADLTFDNLQGVDPVLDIAAETRNLALKLGIDGGQDPNERLRAIATRVPLTTGTGA